MTERSSPPRRKEEASGTPAKSVVAFIAESIRQGLLDGDYVPGQRLVEGDLATALGVSRGPIREAFGRLAEVGLIEIQPHRGAVIRRPSRAEMAELFRVREVLEGLAARTAAERIDVGDARERLERIAEREDRLDASSDVSEHMQANEAFHRSILDLAGNRMLDRSMEVLRMPTYRTAFFRLFRGEGRERSIGQHLQIIAAVRKGDADAAEQAMRNHIRDTQALSREMSDVLFRPHE